MSNSPPSNLIRQLLEGGRLSAAESESFFAAVVRGEMDDVSLAAALAAMSVRGPTLDEVVGAAQALLQHATPFAAPAGPFADVVGTGGDGHNTLNISTLAAITAACQGWQIVKHGNRSISSCSGSFDLLESLQIPFNLSPTESRAQVDRFGICFLYAPNYHAGLKHAGAVRRQLKVRTLFNLLGPLVNPARPQRILLGVARPEWLPLMAEVLSRLDCQHAIVVHGSGVDEVAIHGTTQVFEYADNRWLEYELTPEDFGAGRFELSELICHDAARSHARAREVLSGSGSEAENTAVAVNVALIGKLFGCDDLRENYRNAINRLATGEPMQLVAALAGPSEP